MKELGPLTWLSPQDIIIPKSNEVHIWFIDIDIIHVDTTNLKHFFSDKDIKKVQSIQTKDKKEKTIKRHFTLLKILSDYLHTEPSEIFLEYAEYGKPYLSSDCNKKNIQFNISNSWNHMIVGITLDNEIGVDIEKIRTSVDYEKLIKRFFSEKEKEDFLQLDKDKQEQTFFQWWTMKESVMKAVGLGLYLPIHTFELPYQSSTNTVHIRYKEHSKDYFVYNTLLSSDTKSSFSVEREIQKVEFYKL